MMWVSLCLTKKLSFPEYTVSKSSVHEERTLTRMSTRFGGCCTYVPCTRNGLRASVSAYSISQVEHRCTYTVTARRHRQSVGSRRRSCKLGIRFEVSTCHESIYPLTRPPIVAHVSADQPIWRRLVKSFFLRSTGRTGLEGQGDPIRNGQGAERKKGTTHLHP